ALAHSLSLFLQLARNRAYLHTHAHTHTHTHPHTHRDEEDHMPPPMYAQLHCVPCFMVILSCLYDYWWETDFSTIATHTHSHIHMQTNTHRHTHTFTYTHAHTRARTRYSLAGAMMWSHSDLFMLIPFASILSLYLSPSLALSLSLTHL